MLSSELFGNVTVVFDADQLGDLRSLNPNDASQYVYGLPMSKYAVPNAYYEGYMKIDLDNGLVGEFSLGGNVYNFFNASASSLREYYGVDPSLQGSEATVQGSTLFFGDRPSAVNTTAANEYLKLQGLVPNVPLQISDWAPENDLSVCQGGKNPDCGEAQLDVEAQQAFAPQAVTYFTPNEKLGVWYLVEAARKAGYSEEIQQQILESDKTGKFPTEVAQNLYPAAHRAYFADFVSNVTNSEERIQVASLSWNAPYETETDDWLILEEGLKNLTLSGITILVASGDSGAAARNGEKCLSSDNPLVANQPSYWPIISPWVTVVGGTQFLATADNPQAEVVCSSATGGSITSGGGFVGPSYPQDLFSRPAWQQTAVERYLAENNRSTFAAFPTEADTPGWNPTGRAYPDIAAYGASFPIVNSEGELSAPAGTSLSAPMAAALFSLANQALLRDGYDVIGYANPMVYWMGENCTDAFNDITVGNNAANEIGGVCEFGFPAAPGWDAATGFGSINFGPFVECAKRYQDEVRNVGLEVLPDGSYRAALAGGPTSGSGRTASGARALSLVFSTLWVLFFVCL